MIQHRRFCLVHTETLADMWFPTFGVFCLLSLLGPSVGRRINSVPVYNGYTTEVPPLYPFLEKRDLDSPYHSELNDSNICAVNATCSFRYADPAAEMIQDLYNSLVDADCNLASPSEYPPHYDPKDGEEFDFIVVGAGTAGCVVANRLAEITGWRVLLVEAGGDPTKTSDVPALFPSLQRTEIDWQYKTEPSNKYCLGMEGNRCNWPRGKVLGGSSTINYMVYIRGNPLDFDEWAALGCEGWSYVDVLRYFRKFENMTAKQLLDLPDFHKYHGRKGPLVLEDFQNNEVKPLMSVFLRGMNELGISPNPDANGRRQVGCTPKQGFLKDGRRNSEAKAYLSPIKNRANFKVTKNALVTQVLIDEKSKTAYGIKFIDKDDRVVTVRARKEVILSAGALNSPQLLMLSGIGPRRHLTELGIKVIQDLPVGQDLQDHVFSTNLVITLNYTKPQLSQGALLDFLLGLPNVYSSIGNQNLGCFFNSLDPKNSVPDLEFNFVDFSQNSFERLNTLFADFNYREEIIENYLKINAKSTMLIILGNLLRPYSHGKLLLKSANPKEYPRLIPGYFSDHRDLDTLLRGYDYVTALLKTEPLRKVGARLHEILVPGCNMHMIGTKPYRECALRHLVSTVYHQCATCKMGPVQSPTTVVDPHLRVKGINRLRVIDASIMPLIPRGNINAPVIMVGEKGADLVKDTWLRGDQS